MINNININKAFYIVFHIVVHACTTSEKAFCIS